MPALTDDELEFFVHEALVIGAGDVEWKQGISDTNFITDEELVWWLLSSPGLNP